MSGHAPFDYPGILNRPTIAALDADSGHIIFADGSFADDVDIVLFAKGYYFSFPFLLFINPRNDPIPGLYQHVFYMDDPSLAFISMVTGSFSLRIFEWQTVAVARVHAARAQPLPSRAKIDL